MQLAQPLPSSRYQRSAHPLAEQGGHLLGLLVHQGCGRSSWGAGAMSKQGDTPLRTASALASRVLAGVVWRMPPSLGSTLPSCDRCTHTHTYRLPDPQPHLLLTGVAQHVAGRGLQLLGAQRNAAALPVLGQHHHLRQSRQQKKPCQQLVTTVLSVAILGQHSIITCGNSSGATHNNNNDSGAGLKPSPRAHLDAVALGQHLLHVGDAVVGNLRQRRMMGQQGEFRSEQDKLNMPSHACAAAHCRLFIISRCRAPALQRMRTRETAQRVAARLTWQHGCAWLLFGAWLPLGAWLPCAPYLRDVQQAAGAANVHKRAVGLDGDDGALHNITNLRGQKADAALVRGGQGRGPTAWQPGVVATGGGFGRCPDGSCSQDLPAEGTAVLPQTLLLHPTVQLPRHPSAAPPHTAAGWPNLTNTPGPVENRTL